MPKINSPNSSLDNSLFYLFVSLRELLLGFLNFTFHALCRIDVIQHTAPRLQPRRYHCHDDIRNARACLCFVEHGFFADFHHGMIDGLSIPNSQ